jgi:hypothetical protein
VRAVIFSALLVFGVFVYLLGCAAPRQRFTPRVKPSREPKATPDYWFG